jgi:hypothetical protein
VRDFEAEVALVAEAFFFLFSKLSFTAANNTADISGARLMMSPPFVFFLGDEVFFLGGDCLFVVISIIIRIN